MMRSKIGVDVGQKFLVIATTKKVGNFHYLAIHYIKGET